MNHFYYHQILLVLGYSLFIIIIITKYTQKGQKSPFEKPGLTKIIKNRVRPFCGFELHMSPTKPPMNGSKILTYS